MGLFHFQSLLRRTRSFALVTCAAVPLTGRAETDYAAQFQKEILPILEDHCYQCHGDGEGKGKVRFDSFSSTAELMKQSQLWMHALKNLRSGTMPPAKKERIPTADFLKLEEWIKRGALQLDPQHPDPGRVTLRRLNRTEYRNTIRDLMGIDFHTDEEFPADDTGYGFDNIGDVLSTSSMLLEKYMQAAETIVTRSVPLDHGHPEADARIFTRPGVPQDAAERAKYAEEILRRFATRAFRRPVDDPTVLRLTALAAESEALPDGTFEKGIARAITAVLASSRFLFRIEDVLPESDPQAHPLLDEYALASRLSYFLWSTMPDETLSQLAEKGELRATLATQIARMIQDDRCDELIQNFTGQWLQSRDIDGVSIDANLVLSRDMGQQKDLGTLAERFHQLAHEIAEAEMAQDLAKGATLITERAALGKIFGITGERFEFGRPLRTAMRHEAELLFGDLLRHDQSVLRLIENDSTFLNERLAIHYGIPGVEGEEMRLVKLPPDSPRGGVLTMGSTLAVTSNPTRTSPVKRGLFILSNILGTPPPPPPPDIPSLEALGKDHGGEERPLREALAMHRENPQCASCHDRMDPLGLTMENFNAVGSWRDRELGQPIHGEDGKLTTGETFTSAKELKHLLVTARRGDYYRCLTEKMLTYALGRGPEPYDITTVDHIVNELEKSDGKFSTLIRSIIDSAPFQRRHRTPP
jgi:mono/diheme cytochrome c family protein